MPRELLVLTEGVARTFGRGERAVVAVHGVNCAVRAGDRIALTGPSGSGKTTLLHLLAGLDAPTVGRVTWPAIGSRSELRPGPIAIVFQAPSLLPSLDVLENVELPALLVGIDRTTARGGALEALHRLELSGLVNKLPEELSGGQAQRVAVARALAGRPRLILADEPTGQLDHAAGASVIDALVLTATQIGAALIVNTHDTSISTRLDRQWSMAGGRLLETVAAP
jgi:predicted ABC-type transport system involved in lysophospholipase L1 biosynthesis ATPase subunit